MLQRTAHSTQPHTPQPHHCCFLNRTATFSSLRPYCQALQTARLYENTHFGGGMTGKEFLKRVAWGMLQKYQGEKYPLAGTPRYGPGAPGPRVSSLPPPRALSLSLSLSPSLPLLGLATARIGRINERRCNCFRL